MKKFGTRLISAVLAGCMMTSVLPVSAFALEGSAEFERTVSAQENSDAPAEPSGEVAAACPLTGGNIIDKKFIADHGGSKVYSMSGTYTDGIVIDAENEDVVINVTGETTFDKTGNKEDCANFITVRRAKSVTVNAEGQTITIKAAARTAPTPAVSMPQTPSRAPQSLTAAPITCSVTTSPHAICAAATGRLTISP